jgi:quinol monooxygenase YgiN
MYALNVKFVTKLGMRDEVVKLLDPSMLEQVNSEPGTLLYVMHLEKEDPRVIWFWMVYESEDGFKLHTESEVDEVVSQAFGTLARPGKEVAQYGSGNEVARSVLGGLGRTPIGRPGSR